MSEMPALHVRTLGDGAWGVFTPTAGNGPRLLARCGGPDAEANARLFARAPALREVAAPFAAYFEDESEMFRGNPDNCLVWPLAGKPGIKIGDLRRLAEEVRP